MSCSSSKPMVGSVALDEMTRSQRQEFLSHLQTCASCRRAAAEVDPTVLFSLLPSESVGEGEIEEIRRTVGSMRRIRALESVRLSRGKRAVAAGALAAMLLVAVLLVSRDRGREVRSEVPFAGAVGVGSGLVTVPEESTPYRPVTLRVELARSTRLLDLSAAPVMNRISQVEVTAKAGDLVDRDLGDGYRLQFRLTEARPDGEVVLEDLQLTRTASEDSVLLLEADLQPLGRSPLIMGVAPPEDARGQLWLLLASTTKDRSASL